MLCFKSAVQLILGRSQYFRWNVTLTRCRIRSALYGGSLFGWEETLSRSIHFPCMKSAVDSSILDHLFSFIVEICIDDIFKVIVFAYLGPLRINDTILYQFFSIESRKSCMYVSTLHSDPLTTRYTTVIISVTLRLLSICENGPIDFCVG